MPTFKQRARHMELWMTALGADRPRSSITAADVDRVLQGWLADGLSPHTVRNRRTALQHLWRVLDGPEAANPVRGSRSPREPAPEARAIPYPTITAILGALPAGSRSRARCAVIAWTGLPHAQVKAIRPDDILWPTRQLRTTPRRKGRGAAARIIPLLPQAVDALREFDRLDCYGAFSSSALRRVFRRACDRVGVHGARPYDLRHSYGTLIYQATGDLATTAHLLGHSHLSTAQRYTLAAVPEVAAHAVRQAEALLAAQLGDSQGRRKAGQLLNSNPGQEARLVEIRILALV